MFYSWAAKLALLTLAPTIHGLALNGSITTASVVLGNRTKVGPTIDVPVTAASSLSPSQGSVSPVIVEPKVGDGTFDIQTVYVTRTQTSTQYVTLEQCSCVATDGTLAGPSTSGSSAGQGIDNVGSSSKTTGNTDSASQSLPAGVPVNAVIISKVTNGVQDAVIYVYITLVVHYTTQTTLVTSTIAQPGAGIDPTTITVTNTEVFPVTVTDTVTTTVTTTSTNGGGAGVGATQISTTPKYANSSSSSIGYSFTMSLTMLPESVAGMTTIALSSISSTSAQSSSCSPGTVTETITQTAEALTTIVDFETSSSEVTAPLLVETSQVLVTLTLSSTSTLEVAPISTDYFTLPESSSYSTLPVSTFFLAPTTTIVVTTTTSTTTSTETDTLTETFTQTGTFCASYSQDCTYDGPAEVVQTGSSAVASQTASSGIVCDLLDDPDSYCYYVPQAMAKRDLGMQPQLLQSSAALDNCVSHTVRKTVTVTPTASVTATSVVRNTLSPVSILSLTETSTIVTVTVVTLYERTTSTVQETTTIVIQPVTTVQRPDAVSTTAVLASTQTTTTTTAVAVSTTLACGAAPATVTGTSPSYGSYVYNMYYDGFGYTETDDNPGNDFGDRGPILLNISGDCDDRDSTLATCANFAANGQNVYNSFQHYYSVTDGYWICRAYYDDNQDASYFNVKNLDAIGVSGFTRIFNK